MIPAMIRKTGTPTAMPIIMCRLEFDWPLERLLAEPGLFPAAAADADGVTITILVTVDTDPSLPVVTDLCVIVEAFVEVA